MSETPPHRDRGRALEEVARCRESGNRVELALALKRLGQSERDLHNLDAALEHYEEAAAIYRTEGEPLKLAHTVRHVADILRHQGHADLAEPCYREALAIYRAHPRTPPLDLANAIRGFAVLKDDAGDTADAKALWQEAKDLYAAVDVQAGVDESSRRLARLQA